jgi:hypothetical protein
MAAGFVSQRALSNELNRSGIPTALGGNWHRTSLMRMMTRLGLSSGGGKGLASKEAADAQAKALASTIRELQAKGVVSYSAIARELNAQRIPTARGCKWHPNSTWRLLHRLETLKRSSARRRPMSDAEPRPRGHSR